MSGQIMRSRVTVTATGGGTPKAYTITVTRAASPSTDATLRSLSLSGGATLKQAADQTKGFDPEEDMYTASVAHAVASITVTATPNVSQATVDYPTDDAPGTGGHQVSLNVGSNNEIRVTVTATDGSTTKAYTITVTRAASPSTDATLRSLSLSGGATLDPTFDPDEETYMRPRWPTLWRPSRSRPPPTSRRPPSLSRGPIPRG